ncbi:hypothetical protein [Methanosarcina sp. 2.H.A.1B.4]|uniref:hypothetical protein n=1 Tax=Methanosarcina sp. 2.H.A.1B.4 TaxID=1483600 RepID=UPI00062222CE|nr:hypothetical protein [Methanosarcina sp. 2.H.A.1B.4]KKG12855.1 hypothetical protein EO92_12360 [Methanosarcina sp. 2.H.A.1B.4]
MKRVIIFSVITLLLSNALITTVYAQTTDAKDKAEKTDNGKTITQTLTLYKNGTVVTVPVESGNKNARILNGVEIPQSWKNLSVEKHELTEGDWKFLRDSMTDLSEEEKDKLLNEFKEIIEGRSKLSKEEQTKICQKVGHYIIEATEGSGIQPKWFTGTSGHEGISRAVGSNMEYITSGHVDTLGDYSRWADDNRDQPPIVVVPWPFEYINRHSWVINDSYFYPYGDDFGPDSCEYFMDFARANFTQYDVDSAYINIGKGLHYIEDLGCPYHTTGLIGQSHHEAYENWVSSHWNLLENATDVDTYYIIDDPSEDAKLLASFSRQYEDPISTIIYSDPDWENSTDLINYTRTLICETEKMTIGMDVYASKFESPDTIGSNYVPIRDFQTSYAYINNTACSESMVFQINTEHTYIGNLEVWIGWWDPSSSMYLEQKIWDHEGGSGDNLQLSVYAEGFQDVHNFRLRVVDGSAGDEGAITEFYDLIGRINFHPVSHFMALI